VIDGDMQRYYERGRERERLTRGGVAFTGFEGPARRDPVGHEGGLIGVKGGGILDPEQQHPAVVEQNEPRRWPDPHRTSSVSLHVCFHTLGQADPFEPFPGDATDLDKAEKFVEGDVLDHTHVRA
jgi:hypothetical protein